MRDESLMTEARTPSTSKEEISRDSRARQIRKSNNAFSNDRKSVERDRNGTRATVEPTNDSKPVPHESTNFE